MYFNSHFSLGKFSSLLKMASSLEPLPLTSNKHDPAWKHCQMFKNGDRVQLKCIYCGKIFKGGGIHRIKEHLAGQKGNASTCLRTPPDVRLLMQQSLNGAVVKKRKKQKVVQEITNINQPLVDMEENSNQCDADNSIQMVQQPNMLEPSTSLLVNREESEGKKCVERRKRGRVRNSSATSDAITFHTDNELGSSRVNNAVHMTIGRFLYDVGLPLDAVNSIYFQPMIDAIALQGSGVVAPTFHDLRGWVLKDSVDEVKNDIDRYMGIWGKTGCSVLVDQWDTVKGRTLINFLVYCPEGMVFLKSVDVSDVIDSLDTLCDLIKEVVEEVGVRHVLQVITNGEEHYVAAGRRLAGVLPNLYWSTCAACCIQMILEDFGKVVWINEILEQARSVTRFVYNHSVVLNMMRRYTFGNDLVVPGVTRFDTNFATLKRMVDLKHNLQSMVTSQEWMDCSYSKKSGGLTMLDFLSSESFWSSCILIIHLTDPLLRVLRLAGSEQRPAMGYAYAGMYRAKETIKNQLVKKEDYMIYWNIIDRCWDQQWKSHIHAAGFYLNPKFFYSIEGDIHKDIVSGVFDCIERLVPDIKIQDKIIKELNLYKNAAGDFGRKMAIRARDTLLPAEWWSTYGGGCPNLTRLAIRILSQTCSSVGRKRNHIPFEQIHNTRNFLEHQRLSDLVFVQYNLRLRQMAWKSKEHDSIDPISFESLNKVEDWVTGTEVCLEDNGNSDWMALDPPSENMMLLGPSNDDAEDLGAGFDDCEIFERVKDGEEESVEEKVKSE